MGEFTAFCVYAEQDFEARPHVYSTKTAMSSIVLSLLLLVTCLCPLFFLDCLH